ncbi:MAG: tetratricopeptide repeat protein [Streptosporangiaceae bacterium]
MSETDRPELSSAGPAEDTAQELLLRLGQLLARDGKGKEARVALLSATREVGDPPVAAAAYLALADLEFGQGNLITGSEALVDAIFADPAHPSDALERIAVGVAGGFPRRSAASDTSAVGTEGTAATPDLAPEADRNAITRTVAGQFASRGSALIELPDFPLNGVMLLVEAALRLGQLDQATGFIRLAIAGQGPRTREGICERIRAGALDAATDDQALALLWRAYLLAACGADEDAIAAADDAVEHGVGARDADIQAPALELKAQLLDKAGDTSAAAKTWFEAGKRWKWAEQPVTALLAFERARGAYNDPELPFYRADCLRMQDPPAGKTYRDQMTAALQAWDEGKSAKKIAAWALLVRALINEMLATYGDEPEMRRWTAILDCERAIACKPYDDEDAWGSTPDPAALAEAGSLYWPLGCRATAVWAVLNAWRRQPDDPFVLPSITYVAVNAGLTPPDGLVRTVREQGSGNAWLCGAAGVLAKNSGDLDAADAYLGQAIDKDPTLLWAYANRCAILVQQQRWEEADAVLARMLEQTAPGTTPREPDAATRRAFALVLAGQPGEVLEQQEDLLLASADQADGDAEWTLGMASAFLEDMASFRMWAQRGRNLIASTSSNNIRGAAISLRTAAAVLVHREGPGRQAIAEVLNQEAASLDIEAAKCAEGEFDSDAALRELAAAGQAAVPHGPAWVAARLMRARIMLSQWQEGPAVDLLSEIRHDEVSGLAISLFPEAGLAVTTGFSHAAVSAARRERPDEVAEYLRRGADASAEAGHGAVLASVRGLARSPLLEGLGEPGPFVALSQGLSAFSRLPRWSPAERVKIGITRRQIHRRCYASAYSGIISGGAEEGSALRTSLAEYRIVIEANSALFPQLGDTPGVQWMLSTGIPAMKERLGHDRVPLPGVRIRPADDELSEGGYRFLILGEPVAWGVVRLGGWFCRDPARARVLDPQAVTAAGPDGRPGAWCGALTEPMADSPDAGHENDVADGGASHEDLLDPFAFILEHLTRVLRDRRAALLSRGPFCDLLNSAAEHAGRRALTTAEASAAVAIARQVLALGADPLDPAVLYEQVARDGDGPVDLITGLANVMRPTTPGPGAIPLDAEIEHRLARGLTMTDGKAAVVVAADEAARLQDAFDAWLAEYLGNRSTAVPVVLVRSPQLLLAAEALAIRSRPRCPIGLLGTEGAG